MLDILRQLPLEAQVKADKLLADHGVFREMLTPIHKLKPAVPKLDGLKENGVQSLRLEHLEHLYDALIGKTLAGWMETEGLEPDNYDYEIAVHVIVRKENDESKKWRASRRTLCV